MTEFQHKGLIQIRMHSLNLCAKVIPDFLMKMIIEFILNVI